MMPRKAKPTKLKYPVFNIPRRKPDPHVAPPSTGTPTFTPPTKLPESFRDQAVERLAKWAVREAYDRVQKDCPPGKLPTIHSVGEYTVEVVMEELMDMVGRAVNRLFDAGRKK